MAYLKGIHFFALTAGMVLLLGGCRSEVKEPAASVTTSGATEESSPADPAASQRLQFTAEELLAFLQGITPENLLEKFDTEFEVTGVVKSVGCNYSEGGYIFIGPVKLSTEEDEPWAIVQPGNEVRAQGVISGDTKVRLVEVHGERNVVQAADLAKEYQADKDEFYARRQNQWVEVRGKVLSIEKDDDNSPITVLLEGNGEVPVDCRIPSLGEHRTAQGMKVGDEARIVGIIERGVNVKAPGLFGAMGISKPNWTPN